MFTGSDVARGRRHHLARTGHLIASKSTHAAEDTDGEAENHGDDPRYEECGYGRSSNRLGLFVSSIGGERVLIAVLGDGLHIVKETDGARAAEGDARVVGAGPTVRDRVSLNFVR